MDFEWIGSLNSGSHILEMEMKACSYHTLLLRGVGVGEAEIRPTKSVQWGTPFLIKTIQTLEGT